jgi:uncharacterized protein
MTEIMPITMVMVCMLFFIVAILYAAVGHGGASGYLAVCSLFALEPSLMATSALCLNLCVAGTAWHAFSKERYFSGRLTWPFLATSIPAAFLGGALRVPLHIYGWLLAGALVCAAIRLLMPTHGSAVDVAVPTLRVALPVGAGVGALSGIVGVGGGIFLSPLLLLMRWASPKYVAATSACFIVLNSAAGLAGRAFSGQFVLHGIWSMLLVACAGGLIGSTLGAQRWSGATLRRVLGGVLCIAAVKMIYKAVA